MLRNGRYIPSVLEQHMLTHVPELVVVHTFWKDNPDLFTNMVGGEGVLVRRCVVCDNSGGRGGGGVSRVCSV